MPPAVFANFDYHTSNSLINNKFSYESFHKLMA